MVKVLRSRPTASLHATLTRVVDRDPSLARAKRVLLQPLDVLAGLGREVDGVLAHDDPAAMNRLRRMITMVGPWALQLLEAVEGEPEGDGQTEPPTSGGVDVEGGEVPQDSVQPCHGGLVHTGAMVLLTLAAARVGRRAGKAADHIRTIEALAFAVAPAEGLARGIEDGFTDEQVASVLSIIESTDSVDARLSAVVPTLVDDCELARWHCLKKLIDEVKAQVSWAWETTFSHVIESVAPTEDGVLQVRFHKFDSLYGVAGDALVKELNKNVGTANFVFVDGDGDVIEMAARATPSKYTAKVDIPQEARAGWIGVVTDASKVATRDAMISLRLYWITRNMGLCLGDQPVDTSVIPEPRPDEVRRPPQAPDARWGVKIVDHWLEQAGGGPLHARTDTDLIVALAGADPETVVRVVVGQTPLAGKVDGGHARFEIPGHLVVDGEDARIEVFRTRADLPDDSKAFTLEVVGPPATAPEESRRQVVLLTPMFVDGGNVRRAGELVSALRMRSNVPSGHKIQVLTLPWLDDEELVFEGVPQSAHDPVVTTVLERLAGIAARTPGIERATVIAVVPGNEAFFALQPAESAQGVALATASALDDVLAQPIPPPRPRTRRLRVVGRIHRDDVVIDEPVRVEADRPAGGQAPYLTQVLAVAVDEHGRELRSERIAIHAASRMGRFSLLLPVGPEVAGVELRSEPELLAVELRAQPQTVHADFRGLGTDVATMPGLFPARVFERPRALRAGPLPVIDRPSGTPILSGVALDGDDVTWKYRHTHGARGRIEVEVGRGDGIWSRFGVSDSHRARISLADLRTLDVRPPTELRLIASDGWNTVESPTLKLNVSPERRRGMLVRQLGNRRFWLEARSDTGRITWTLDGEFKAEREPGEIFVVEPGDVGKTVRAATEAGVFDEITIGG